MIKKNSRVELDQQVGTPVPPYEQGGTWQGGTRLDEICRQLGTRVYAAKIAGISDDQLAGYIYGRSKPGFLPLWRLCEAAGKSLDWLATGIEPAESSMSYAGDALDEAALARALEVVEEVGAGVPLGKRARLLKLAYTLYIRSGSALDQPSLKALVKEAISQTM